MLPLFEKLLVILFLLAVFQIEFVDFCFPFVFQTTFSGCLVFSLTWTRISRICLIKCPFHLFELFELSLTCFPDSVRINRLGGAYENGKPLPKWLRREIIALAQSGLRQCDISRRLRITHGCVSKILWEYQRTGHLEPGRELRIITTLRTDECIQEQPEIGRVRHEDVCGTEPLQLPSSIPRSSSQTRTVEQMEPRKGQEQGADRRSYILADSSNVSSKEQPSTTSNESQPRQQSGVSRELTYRNESRCIRQYYDQPQGPVN